MLMNKAKNSKSETPTRNRPMVNKITPTINLGKKSDPFLKQLKQIYDKENIHPNTKSTRINSYNSKETDPSEARNSHKKILCLKNNKNVYFPVHQSKINKEYQTIQSNNKYHSTQLQKPSNSKNQSNRNSTDKDQVKVSHFQEEYYSVKDQKREKKMKLTLKDMKKQKKMLQNPGQNEYMGKLLSGETKQSGQVQVSHYQKLQTIKKQHSLQKRLDKSTDQSKVLLSITYYSCINHPEKRATRRLVQQNVEESYKYCQKCAVNLATKGYSLIKLTDSYNVPTPLYTIHKNQPFANSVSTQDETQQERRQNLHSFLLQLDKMKPKFMRSQQDLLLSKQILKQKYQIQQSKLKIYYNRIQQLLQNSYNSNIFKLKLHYQSLQQQIQNKFQKMKSQFYEMQQMKKDILPNVDKIIEESFIQESMFKEIIQNYYLQYYHIKEHLSSIHFDSISFYQVSGVNEEKVLHFLSENIDPRFQQKIFQAFKQKSAFKQILDQEEAFRMSFGKDNNRNSKNFRLL